jgi:hypothetical protein
VPLLAVAAPLVTASFSDLTLAPGGCTRIQDAAHRAATLDQLRTLLEHTARRCGYTQTAPPSESKDTLLTSNAPTGNVQTWRHDLAWLDIASHGLT